MQPFLGFRWSDVRIAAAGRFVSAINALANNSRYLLCLTLDDVHCREYLAVAQTLAFAFDQHKMPALEALSLTITDRRIGDANDFNGLDQVKWVLPQRMRSLSISTDGRRAMRWFVNNWPQIHGPHLQRLYLKPNAEGMLRVAQTVGR